MKVDKEYYYEVGYHKMGPLLSGFERWLEKKVYEDKIDLLLFASREGCFFQKGYQGNVRNHYFWVSRKSLQKTLIWQYKEIDDFISDLENKNVICHLKTVLNYFDLGNNDIKQIIQDEQADVNGVIEGGNLNNAEYRAIKSIFERYNKLIYEKSYNQFLNYKKYFEQLEISGKRIGFVDIGWRGNMQISLLKLLQISGYDCYFKGYYMLLQSNTVLSEKQANSYLKGNVNVDEDMFSAFGGLLEILCSAKHGTIIKLKNNNGQIEPECDKWENEKNSLIIESFQNGAIAYVKDNKNTENLSTKEAYGQIVELGIKPTLKQLKMFSNLYFNNCGSNSYIGHVHWKKSIKENLKEILLSGWKIGCLRNILKVPLPYWKIYKFIKKSYSKRK